MKIVSWNIEGRLTQFTKSGRGSPEGILKNIEELNGDIVFLPEASDNDAIDLRVIEKLQRLGYSIATVPYEGREDRKWAAGNAPNMKLLSKVLPHNFQQIRLGDLRNALVADIALPGSGTVIRFFGIHLDDRNEELRLRQLNDLLPLILGSPFPVIVAGDFNAMHGGSRHARIFRSKAVRLVAKCWPHPRTKDGWRRIVEMAEGQVMRTLMDRTGLKEADPLFSPTETPKMRHQEWMPSVRLAQIDHILVSPEIKVADFAVARDGGADHRAISATISLSGQSERSLL